MSLNWKNIADAVRPVDTALYDVAQAHLDSLTKPQGSLGRLEELACRLFAISGGKTPLRADRAVMYTVAGDHGVTEEGVTLYPQAVTRQMVANFLGGGAGINVLCHANRIDLRVVDAGCAGGPYAPHPLILDRRMGDGTANFAQGPAMSRETCVRALEVGMALAEDAARDGYDCVGMGELGIGNSTSAAALYATYFHIAPEDAVGPGAGLPRGGLAHKAAVIRRAFAANATAHEGSDPLDKLAAFGGFEIAVKAGLVLGCAALRLPLVVDGFISTAAFAAACALCPAAAGYGILSHCSAEPGYAAAVAALGGFPPLLPLGMRLGEGTGAALAIPLLRSAAAVYNSMATFAEAGVDSAS